MLRRAGGLWTAFMLALAGPAAGQNKVEPGDLPRAVEEVFFTALAWIGDDQPSSGSGFLVSEDGHVLTAWHVLDNIRKAEGGGRDSTYIKSRYTLRFNMRDREPCRTSANLVGASEYRDVAVLQINTASWKRRDVTGSCLAQLKPVSFNLAVPEEDAGEDAPLGVDGFMPASGEAEMLFGETIFPLGHPSACLSGSGDACVPHPFDAWSTSLLRRENAFGLIEVRDQVPRGMSGGPAVMEDGTVIGMIVASGRDMGKERVELVPARALERPLWTFGITLMGASMKDYFYDMRDILARKGEIDEALKTLEQLNNSLHKPEFVDYSVESANVKVGNTVVGSVEFVVLDFRKQLQRMSSPERFDFEVVCNPDRATGSLLFAVTEDQKAQAVVERGRLFVPSTHISESNTDPLTGNIKVLINRPIEDIQNACVAYLRRLAELSGQDAAGITAGSLQSISIFPTASFADKGVDAHRLEGIEISFSGDSP